jgi:DNA-directed RNA polymerase subunit M/transcription elongation factor TFIIS
MTCPKCGSEMLLWRKTDISRSLACRNCMTVKIQAANETKRGVAGSDGQVLAPSSHPAGE